MGWVPARGSVALRTITGEAGCGVVGRTDAGNLLSMAMNASAWRVSRLVASHAVDMCVLADERKGAVNTDASGPRGQRCGRPSSRSMTGFTPLAKPDADVIGVCGWIGVSVRVAVKARCRRSLIWRCSVLRVTRAAVGKRMPTGQRKSGATVPRNDIGGVPIGRRVAFGTAIAKHAAVRILVTSRTLAICAPLA